MLTFNPKSGKLVPVPGKSIRLPSVFPFAPSTATPNPSIAFNRLLSQLLTDLEACWTQGASLATAISDMTKLGKEGRRLINEGIRPDFAWLAIA